MLHAALAVLTALAVLATAAATNMLTVHAGERVTMHVDERGLTIVDREQSPPLSSWEAQALREGQTIKVPPGVQTVPPVALESEPANLPSIKPGQLRITFRKVPANAGSGVNVLLTLENGYGRSIAYRAVMHRGERAAPTDVCEVFPGKRSFEHWPFELDSLDLSDFQLVDSVDGQMRCQ